MLNDKLCGFLEKDFVKYLEANNLSKKSVRNYKSDMKHFCDWLDGAGFKDFSLLTSAHIRDYIDYLKKDEISFKTINRKLSTLRGLANYLVKGSYCDINFMESITNLKKSDRTRKESLIDNFVFYLRRQKVSNKTIKNYRSDIEQFLSWLAKKNIEFAEMKPYHVRLYGLKLAKEKSSATVKRHISSLKQFISWNEGISDKKTMSEYSFYQTDRPWSMVSMLILLMGIVSLTQGLISEKPLTSWQGVLNGAKKASLADYDKLNQSQNFERWPLNNIQIVLAKEPVARVVDENEIDLSLDSSFGRNLTSVSDYSFEFEKGVVGLGYIPSGKKDVAIYDDRINKLSFVLLTPTSSTNGQSLFVKTQGTGYLVVAIDNALEKDINFNWWVSNY